VGLLLNTGHAAPAAPSDWVVRWAHLIAPGGTVLDLACGSGRHLRWLAGRGHRVTGVDRDGAALVALRGLPGVDIVEADVENGPWPLDGCRFDAVVVTNYLWRPLLPRVAASLADGGVLLYETFADGQQSVGRPARPDFLLQPGELLRAFAGLRVVAFEDGFVAAPAPGRFVQRLAAVAGDSAFPGAGRFPRHGLAGAGG
jgi:SAM-dependent methyltransferase